MTTANHENRSKIPCATPKYPVANYSACLATNFRGCLPLNIDLHSKYSLLGRSLPCKKKIQFRTPKSAVANCPFAIIQSVRSSVLLRLASNELEHNLLKSPDPSEMSFGNSRRQSAKIADTRRYTPNLRRYR